MVPRERVIFYVVGIQNIEKSTLCSIWRRDKLASPHITISPQGEIKD
jgi:hypothetical protein